MFYCSADISLQFKCSRLVLYVSEGVCIYKYLIFFNKFIIFGTGHVTRLSDDDAEEQMIRRNEVSK